MLTTYDIYPCLMVVLMADNMQLSLMLMLLSSEYCGPYITILFIWLEAFCLLRLASFFLHYEQSQTMCCIGLLA